MRRYILLGAIAAILSCASILYADGLLEFSAVMVEKDGSTVESNKIYVTKDKSRYDGKDGAEIVITRYDKRVMWIIFPKYGRYVEQPCTEVQPQTPVKPMEGTFGDMTRKLVANEVLDSYRTKKFLITIVPGGKEKYKYQYYEWYRDNFPFPVKVAALIGNSSTEYTKIKFAPMDPDLFAVPKRYKKSTLEEIEALEKSDKKK